MSQAASVSKEKKARKKGKRGSAAPNDLRNAVKEFEKLVRKFPFLEDEAGNLRKALCKSIQSQSTKTAVDAETHEWVRATLATMFRGSIEDSLRLLKVKELNAGTVEDNIRRKERFGEIWRKNKRYYFTPEQTAELKAA